MNKIVILLLSAIIYNLDAINSSVDISSIITTKNNLFSYLDDILKHIIDTESEKSLSSAADIANGLKLKLRLKSNEISSVKSIVSTKRGVISQEDIEKIEKCLRDLESESNKIQKLISDRALQIREDSIRSKPSLRDYMKESELAVHAIAVNSAYIVLIQTQDIYKSLNSSQQSLPTHLKQFYFRFVETHVKASEELLMTTMIGLKKDQSLPYNRINDIKNVITIMLNTLQYGRDLLSNESKNDISINNGFMIREIEFLRFMLNRSMIKYSSMHAEFKQIRYEVEKFEESIYESF